MKAKTLQDIFLGLLSVALLLSVFIPIFHHTNVRRFHEDEHIFVRRGIFLDYYLAGKFFDPVWQTFESSDVPKFGEFFYGAVLRIYSGKAISEYLEPEFVRPLDSSDYFWYLEYSRNHCCSIQDLPTEIQNRLKPVLVARKAGVFFALGSLALLFLLCWQLRSWLFGATTVLILGQNFLFKDSLTTAMGDGPLIFWSLLYAYTIGLFFASLRHSSRKRLLLLYLIAGVAAGLATATKLNGVINLLHFLLASTYVFFQAGQPFKALKYQAGLVVIAYATFFILNPFLWTHPVRNSLFMMVTRQVTIEKQQQLSEENHQTLRTLPERVSKTYERTLQPLAVYSNFPQESVINAFGVLFFLGGIVGGVNLILSGKVTHLASSNVSFTSFFLWVLSWMLITTLLIPLDWDHYYLPIVIGISVLQSFAVSEVLRKLLSKFPALLKIVPEQK